MLRFLISIAGTGAVPLAELRLNLVSITKANLRPDTAAIKWTGKLSETCPIEHDDEVDLYLRDVRVFSGRARLGTRNAEGLTITAGNALAQLDKMILHTSSVGGYPMVGTTYQTTETAQWYDTTTNTWRDPVNPVTWTWSYIDSYQPGLGTGTKNINSVTSTNFYLCPPSGGPTSAQAQFIALCYLAENMPTPVIQRGAINFYNPLVFPRPQLVSDISFAEGLRRSLELIPDAAVWFDYSTFPPSISMRRFSGQEAVNVDYGYPLGLLISHEIERLDHLIPSCVVIRRMTGGNAAVFEPPYVSFAAVWPATEVATQPDAICLSVSDDVATDIIQVLAYVLYESLKTPRGQGTVVVYDPAYTLPLRPGNVLSANGIPSTTDLELCIQSATWSAATGQTTCQVGFPPHLGLTTLLDMHTWLHRAWFGR